MLKSSVGSFNYSLYCVSNRFFFFFLFPRGLLPAFSAKSSFLQYCGEKKVELLCTLQGKRKVVLHLSTTKFCIKLLLLLALSNILKELCVYRAINTQNFYFGSSLVCILAKTSSKNSVRGRVEILKKEKSAF